MSRVVRIDGEEYEIIPEGAVMASKIISDFHKKLGEPEDPFSRAGEKLMEIIIAVWEDLYPEQVSVHYARIKDYRENELSAREQVSRSTGRSLASVPTPIYKMAKAVFPNFKMNNREDFLRLADKYPIFRITNKV